jgi:dipeptidase D
MDIIDLNPKRVWKHFYSLTRIPRPSKKEEKIRAFLAEYGKKLGLETIVDEIGNVIIRKPATPDEKPTHDRAYNIWVQQT